MRYELISPIDAGLSTAEQIFVNRGLRFEDIPHYLNTTDADLLSPTLLANIHAAAQTLLRHIFQRSKALVIVDSDVDGLTSSAILINYLNRLFPAWVQNNVSYRLHQGKQHGILTPEVGDVQLVIAPDSSSNEYEIHQALQEKGIDVIVLDHHEAPKVSEHAIVVNNQLCDYPTKTLSGAGIVYKFCQYLDQFSDAPAANEFCDLAALGLIADMVSLKDFETRHIISKGLRQINNPYFQAMVNKQAFSLGDTITPIGVAFYIAPYMNAMCRSGTMEEKTLLFESMLEYRAYEKIPSTKRGDGPLATELRVDAACRICSNVKTRQGKERDNSLDIMEHIIEDRDLSEDKVILIKLQKRFGSTGNITGLIANELMANYQRPVLILRETEHDKEIWWEGSGRGYEKSDLKDFRKIVEESGLVEYAEGHANAFGCGVKDENITQLIEYLEETLKDYDFSRKYNVDFIYDYNSIEPWAIETIAGYKAYWGQGIEEPKVVIENVPVRADNTQLMKGKTLKIQLPDNLSAVKFFSNADEYNSLVSEQGCTRINLVGTCDINTWNYTPQIKIIDYEITQKFEYYF